MASLSNRRRRLLCAILALAVLCTAFLLWHDRALTVSRYEYASAEVSEEMDGFRIMQLSDLHSRFFGKGQIRLLRLMEREQPDLILLTGDMLDERRIDLQAVASLMKGAAAIAPVYSVTGNHEHWLSGRDFDALKRVIEENGGVNLWDQTVRIGGESGFWLTGLEYGSLRDDTLSKILPADGLTLVMAHAPQYLEQYARTGADLVFAGHAHGGQVRLPFLGPLYAPGQGFLPKYAEGMYRLGATAMAVSRGLGNSSFPLRILNPPDVVMVTLKAEAQT